LPGKLSFFDNELLVELRVMNREEILPTYRSPRWFAHRKVKWS
jgi:hypothetical protein